MRKQNLIGEINEKDCLILKKYVRILEWVKPEQESTWTKLVLHENLVAEYCMTKL